MIKKPVTFLLVDDDEDDQELFQLALEEADDKVQLKTAGNGCEALDLLKEADELPDYIFLDLNMPMMGGKECLAELKSDHRFGAIPVVIFSTSSDPRDRNETKELGAVDFMTKPSRISELTQMLTQFIDNAHNLNTSLKT